ncbi:hypothetical protein SERLA73DRAFT_104951 [Serpula lacrymans var. lacrymans S7.3]|uniref:NADP-dependent oxidoreductase domain-containing protein n=2 Tax=Serpula lacrymans var. lacrymans TaxID=341189 RepID=F8PRP0_SERL3|nr:uncharacterized protein SERLADRAFT_447414 [Serpula lacrymans var. lacrymans S7.9]EGO00610.1 hypothetical protein SERLA73DRAFT_104951 [Serpula lacrymans var. lacrymans S7.3]EGO26166.1 hypothetical protein SERLADRAFT_447414 [Serpula lacrymans var. lacrymans S7.9]
MTVPTLALNDGNAVPWIGFGTGTALFYKDAREAVHVAIQNGFTHIDGAQVYTNEETLGTGVIQSGKPRSELFITTKLYKLQPGATPKSALQESLKRLKLDQVDLYLVHNPNNHVGQLKEVWKGMEECKKDGLTKSIGVSNFAVEHFKEIFEVASIPPSVNQLELHPYVWKALQPVLEIHKEHGIVTSSYGGLSPLFRGESGPLNEVVESIRERLQATRGQPVSDSQVLSKWLQQKGVLVITTSSKAERVREYIDTTNVPDLTAEELALVERAGSLLHQRFFQGNWLSE